MRCEVDVKVLLCQGDRHSRPAYDQPDTIVSQLYSSVHHTTYTRLGLSAPLFVVH